ncbi:MAG: tetratricopeptide repeat protein [Bacteroidales bacterium]|nr:tetratricopeptide repeat protein [Bacteroidales bacterium]
MAPGQQTRKSIREGNRQYKNEKYDQAEIAYRKALNDTQLKNIAGFNLGDALYRQKNYKDAGNQFDAIAQMHHSPDDAAKAYHNLGNSLLQAGQIRESIEAYKNALRQKPDDMDTKYNLAYARYLLKKQEQQKQKQKQKQQNKNQDQKKNQDKQQNQNQNQNQQQQQQQQQQQNNQKQPNNQNRKPQKAIKISPRDAMRLLAALANDEKKVQEKVKKEKAKANRVRTLKDW